MCLHTKLQNLRESRFWTISYVSQCTHISAASISAYERGRYLPTLTNFCILADFYGVSTDYLLGREDALKAQLHLG